ncbi:MAG: pathogenicity locus [Methanothrix sp.]|nr:MAG: pathogenicity locus [Methanothrix sp.]
MRSSSNELEEIPGVGKVMAKDLQDLGVHTLFDLQGRDPEGLYRSLCDLRKTPVDRCVLYVFRCAVYYASNVEHDQEKLKWWNWKDGELTGAEDV